jgi:hypothetical protein
MCITFLTICLLLLSLPFFFSPGYCVAKVYVPMFWCGTLLSITFYLTWLSRFNRSFGYKNRLQLVLNSSAYDGSDVTGTYRTCLGSLVQINILEPSGCIPASLIGAPSSPQILSSTDIDYHLKNHTLLDKNNATLMRVRWDAAGNSDESVHRNKLRFGLKCKFKGLNGVNKEG